MNLSSANFTQVIHWQHFSDTSTTSVFHVPLRPSLLVLSRAYYPFSVLLWLERCRTYGDASLSCCLRSSSRVHLSHWWRSAHGECKTQTTPYSYFITTEHAAAPKVPAILVNLCRQTQTLVFFQVVLCSHLHVRRLCRHLLCDLCLCGGYHAGTWEEHSVWFGKEMPAFKLLQNYVIQGCI